MKQREIKTREELDALPIFAVVRDADPAVCEKVGWSGWRVVGDEEYYTDADVTLPALLLWEPIEDEAP